MSTEFLSLAMKHLIVHSCGALCITVVHVDLVRREMSSVSPTAQPSIAENIIQVSSRFPDRDSIRLFLCVEQKCADHYSAALIMFMVMVMVL